MARLSPAQLEILKYDWSIFARDKQLEPQGNAPSGNPWRVWVPLAGRGFGKTRMGAEWVRSSTAGRTPLSPGKYRHIALVGETAADVRDVMIEGVSGILACTPKDFRPTFIANRRSLEWPNGAKGTLFSAIEPDQLRGPQFDLAWCDELAKWRYGEHAWDMLQMALRLGDHPRCLVTTTPRPSKFLKDILKDPDTISIRGSTYENAGNLAEGFTRYILRKYEGTRLGRQELEAAILEDVPGALWTLALLDRDRIGSTVDEAGNRVLATPPELQRKVVAVDPPVTSGEKADECGMIVCGIAGSMRNQTGHGYVLADYSTQGQTPREWATAAINAYHRHDCDEMIAEVNNGGELVETVVKGIDPTIKFRAVHASKGKYARAEPISSLYEQGRVHHVGTFAALEDQMVAFCIDGLPDPSASPDRVDALVWGLTALMISATQAEPRARSL